MQQTIDIAANLERVRERIEAAAARTGRPASEITLVAVSKTKPVALIEQALAAGQLDFGENRPEEAWEKFANADSPGALRQRLPTGPAGYRLHLIGPIQSRKSDLAVACRPALIHSLDRLKIARRLDRLATEQGLILDVLLEANVSGEESKFGFTPQSLMRAMDELPALPGLRLNGLMTIPPYDPDPELARPFFQELRRLREQWAQRWPEAGWQHLSMGMSHDFEVAIEEGASIIRVGTAIFDER